MLCRGAQLAVRPIKFHGRFKVNNVRNFGFEKYDLQEKVSPFFCMQSVSIRALKAVISKKETKKDPYSLTGQQMCQFKLRIA